MFERYTEKARRCIFFARYEAANLAAPEIETEHLLLGILREDKFIAGSLLAFKLTTDAVRDKIAQQRQGPKPRILTSVDVPFSHALKRALAYSAEESERLGLKKIGPECLLLGLARDRSCFASRILSDAGITAAELRHLTGSPSAEHAPAQDSEGFRDLTQLAAAAKLTPLIGRDAELLRAVRILSRRTRNSVAIIGDPGVGKTALIEGLAQYLATGQLEQFAEYRILLADAESLFPVKPGPRGQKLVDDILWDLAARGQTLLAIEGLFDLALARADWGVTEAWGALSPHIASGRLQCIATGAPASLEATLAKAPDLARGFEVIPLAAPEPDQAVKILEALIPKYEEFHRVIFAPGTIEMAVHASGRFLPQRSLPDRALDLLDEAAAHARVRTALEPPEVVAARKEVRRLARDFEYTLTHEKIEEARALSDLERAARDKLKLLLEQRQNPAVPSVTSEDIEQVAADRVGAPLSAIRAILAKKGPADLDEILARLAARLSVERNPWLPLFAAYLARASGPEIDALIEAIRAARSAGEAP